MRRRAWFLVAAALLAAAAWLMARGDARARRGADPRVVFPRSPRPAEHDRIQRRRTLPPPAAAPEDAPAQKRDPVLTALPPTPGKSAVVFEASALKGSPIGKRWLDCMISKNDLSEIDRMKK